MSRTGIGIIGTGAIAAVHGPTATSLSDTRLVASLSRQESTAKEFLVRLGAQDARPYTDLAAFVADPAVDLVIVASPDKVHFSHAQACLRAGKHVLLEKPMTVSVSEAQALVDLAEASRLVLATGYHLRSHAGHKELLSRLRNGDIGTIRHIRAMWSWPQKDDSNWRARDEVGKWWSLAGVGTHCLDLARWFTGYTGDWAQFRAVLSNSVWHGPHDETAIIAAQLPTGTTVEVTSSVQFDTYHRVEIFGERGIAVCHGTLGHDGAGEIQVNGQRLDFTPVNPFAAQLTAVLGAIAGSGRPPADGRVGLRGVKDLLLASDA